MKFSDALNALLAGKKVKRPSWHGNWEWVEDNIQMNCKDGTTLKFTDTEQVLYTLQNVAADDWEIVEAEKEQFSPIQTFSFSDALRFVKAGEIITRKGWNGNGMYVMQQVPDEFSKMTRPYLYLECPKGSTKQFGDTPNEFDRVPWLASQTDLLANDWMLAV